MKKYINILLIAILLLTTSIISTVSYGQNTPDLSSFKEVYPNLNDFNKDRVNIVFYFEDTVSIEQARKVVDGYLRYNGPVTEVYNANNNSRVLKTGLFQMYPFTEAREKFNFLISFSSKNDRIDKIEKDKNIFRNFIPVLHDLTTNGINGGGGIDFGSKVIFNPITKVPKHILMEHYNGVYSEEYDNVFIHELSHFMFKLEDEYYTENNTISFDINNCAESLETAQSLWGNTVGKLSKSYLYMKELLKDYYLINQNAEQIPQFSYLESSSQGAFIKTQCAGLPDYYVTSRTNIMNQRVPFYSPYQESIAENVLAKYTGKTINIPADPKPVDPKPTPTVVPPVVPPASTPKPTPVQTSTPKPIVQSVQPKKETVTVRTGAPYYIGIALSFIVIFFTTCIVILKRNRIK